MKRIALFSLLFLISMTAFSQETSESLFEKTGIIFGFQDLLNPKDFEDGYQTGVGVKAWLSDSSALRVLLRFQLIPTTDPSTSHFGLGAAYEHHFVQGTVSPYLGAFAGTSVVTDGGGSTVDLYFGGIFGGEMKLLDYLNIFGEYNLIFTVNDDGFGIDFGTGNNAHFGFILYF